MLLRILLITLIGLAVYFGIRRIWKDWTQKFDKDAEEAKLSACEASGRHSTAPRHRAARKFFGKFMGSRLQGLRPYC